MKNILEFFRKDDIGEPPWNYYFLQNLDEKEYPKYLAKIFNYRTGEKLPLFNGVIDKKRCKTFNQKIQWIKLYGVTDLMRKCTDKVAVRDYVKEKIGEEYLKPVLQIIPSCHSENLENQNVNLVDFQVVQNLKEELNEEKMLKHACVNDEIQNEKINKTAVQHDRLLGALCPNVINKSDVLTYFLKSALQIIPNESQETMHCHCEQTNDHLMSARQSTLKSEHTMDLPLEKRNLGVPFSRQSDTQNEVVSRNDGKLEDVSTYFDRINFDKLPNALVIKCNHGSKWQYIIKDKNLFLQNKQLFEIVRRQITGWLEQDYSIWNGFELNYRNIAPKILIEPLMQGNINTAPREIEVYCFNGKPKIYVNVRYGEKREISYYDENFNNIDLIFHDDGKNIIKDEKADCLIEQTIDLSIRLSKDFNFVRVDWLIFNNKLYFNELTFTPYSGFINFDKKWNFKLADWI